MSRFAAFAAGAAFGTLVGAYGAQNYEVHVEPVCPHPLVGLCPSPHAPPHCPETRIGPKHQERAGKDSATISRIGEALPKGLGSVVHGPVRPVMCFIRPPIAIQLNRRPAHGLLGVPARQQVRLVRRPCHRDDGLGVCLLVRAPGPQASQRRVSALMAGPRLDGRTDGPWASAQCWRPRRR